MSSSLSTVAFRTWPFREILRYLLLDKPVAVFQGPAETAAAERNGNGWFPGNAAYMEIPIKPKSSATARPFRGPDQTSPAHHTHNVYEFLKWSDSVHILYRMIVSILEYVWNSTCL